MLHLRNHLLSAVRAASPPPAAASLHHLLLLSTAAASPAGFVVEEFLVTCCGLTRAQALKSAKRLSHLKSPSKSEAVVAFLTNFGLTKADVAAAIAKEPRLLCRNVDKILNPRISMLRDIGLSPPQICRLITIAPYIFCSTRSISRLAFYLSFLGSYEKLHTVLRSTWSGRLLYQDVERVVKPNIAFMHQCGLTDSNIADLLLLAPIILLEPEHAKEIVERADKFRVPRNSAMFKHVLKAIYFISPERIDAKMDLLKKAIGCSEAELSDAVSRFPFILNLTEVNISHTVDFLKKEVGLESEYIVQRPSLVGYSLKRRLMPRHYVLKILKAKGFLKKDMDYFSVVCLREKRFVERFVDRYKECVPGLTSSYAAGTEGREFSVPPEIQL